MSWAWAFLGLALANVIAFLVMRASFVSLNKDLRAMLDGQSEIRERLDALEANQ